MLSAYRLLGLLLSPLLLGWYLWRLSQGKEEGRRWRERWGLDRSLRGEGTLIWVHAASVGESLAVLPLLERLRQLRPDCALLLTTGTVTSATILAERLPDGCRHRFLPLDSLPAVQGFLHHWRPDLGLFVESELWPCLMTESFSRGIPLAVINGRLSARSARFWQRMRRVGIRLAGCFRLVLAQTEGDAERYRQMGAPRVWNLGNLKYDAPPLPCDAAALQELQQRLASRPRWVAASTHPGEERQIAEAHRLLKTEFPDLLSIIVPRHAHRGDELAAALRTMGLTVAQRSAGEPPNRCDIYLADTMGELGLFYRLCPLAFLGGSLVPHGGQNPLEAARLGCALVTGPHVHNFPDICADLRQDDALTIVADSAALAAEIRRLLQDAEACRLAGERSRQSVAKRTGVLDRLVAELTPLLPTRREKPL